MNREGDRFVQELDRRDVISNGIKNQTDGVAFLLFDQAAADETGCSSSMPTSTRTARLAALS